MQNDLTVIFKYIQCGDTMSPSKAIGFQVLWILPPSICQGCLMPFKLPNDIMCLMYADCALLSSPTPFLIETKSDRCLGLTSTDIEHCKGT